MVRRSSCSNNNNNNNSYDGSNVCDVTGSFLGGFGVDKKGGKGWEKEEKQEAVLGGFFTLQSLALARAPSVVGEKKPFLFDTLPLSSPSPPPPTTPVSTLI